MGVFLPGNAALHTCPTCWNCYQDVLRIWLHTHTHTRVGVAACVSRAAAPPSRSPARPGCVSPWRAALITSTCSRVTPVFCLAGGSATFPISPTFSLPGSSKPAWTPFSISWDTTRRPGEEISAGAACLYERTHCSVGGGGHARALVTCCMEALAQSPLLLWVGVG